MESVRKYNGVESVPLSISQIKQIAGRAGRYRTRYEYGVACTYVVFIFILDFLSHSSWSQRRFQNGDMPALRKAMALTELPPLEMAGLFPTLEQIEAFANIIPSDSSFAELLVNLSPQISKVEF
jgi:ATP-dependent RNA helicase SUPV3L1/SUV3